MKRLFLTTIVCLFCSVISIGQASSKYPLEVGQTIPDLQVTTRLNNSFQTVALKKNPGQLILLDFWGIDCPECIFFVPELVKLQEHFGDSIRIIVVTENSSKEVDSVYENLIGKVPDNVIHSKNRIPFVTGDTVLKKLFPHPNGLPMHVYVGKDKKYIASTKGQTTNRKNIQLLINGGLPSLDKYYVYDINYKNVGEWFKKRFQPKTNLKKYSFFTGFDTAVKANGFVYKINDSSTGKIDEIFCINRSVPELYQIAYYGKISNDKNFIKFDFENQNNLYPSYDEKESIHEWVAKNQYCYAKKSSSISDSAFYAEMIQDLDNFFGYKSGIKNVELKFLVFKSILPVAGTKRKSQLKEFSYDWIATKDSKSFIFHNALDKDVFDQISSLVPRGRYPIYIINEAIGLGRSNLEINLPANITLSDIKKEIKKVGYDLVENKKHVRAVLVTKR